MTRLLVIIAILVAAAFVALIIWPRDANGSSGSSAALSQTQSGSGTPASFTILVDGQEVLPAEPGSTRRMADLPPADWNSAMVSHVRALGSSQILVFVDGSEAMLDSFTLDRLPEDVAYRARYDRD